MAYSFNFISFCREIILGNLVSQVMRGEEFEDPIDTVGDLVDRNIIVLYLYEHHVKRNLHKNNAKAAMQAKQKSE